ncbi:MAG TPA: glycosyltransferase [Patescibacteria group bacterium]|nr:glycosyltransferase [Patescibacteria group bacterium]
MIIGIDISQTAYQNTGVANYLTNLVVNLLEKDSVNKYILFFSSFRGKPSQKIIDAVEKNPSAVIKKFKFPPQILDTLWNKLHAMPIENLIGNVDILLTSDWTEPPAKKAKKGTIIYDLVVYKYPEETDKKIIETQKRKLSWVKKESQFVICISDSTKNDTKELLGINPEKISVIYPGF